MIGLLRRLWAKQRHPEGKTLWRGSLWESGLGGGGATTPPAAPTNVRAVFIPD